MPGLPVPTYEITTEPRRYGFHGTIRAPFRPAKDLRVGAIGDMVAVLATRLAPVACEGLRLENMHGFLALTPIGCKADLLALGAAVVEGTEILRAPLTEAEMARRHADSLSSHQRKLLHRWGYPYVMDEFRFHLTLTDRLPADQEETVAEALEAQFASVMPCPFVIEDLCLFGEDDRGAFHLLHRHVLSG